MKKAELEAYIETILAELPHLRERAIRIADPVLKEINAVKERAYRQFRDALKNSRKDFAIWTKEHADTLIQSLLFALYDGKEDTWDSPSRKMQQESWYRPQSKQHRNMFHMKHLQNGLFRTCSRQ